MITESEKARIRELSRWDAKIGVIYISSSLTLEREWHMVLPKSISFHTTRISLDDDDATEETLTGMLESGQVENAARKLASAEVDVIAFACTAGSFIRGAKWDQTLAAKIQEASGGIPSTTTSSGLLAALRLLGCRKIHAATPYLDEINVLEQKFLEENGISVSRLIGEQCIKDQDIARVPPERFIQIHEELLAKDHSVDGLFISCTNSQTLEAIEILEQRYGLPVLSSNQVTLWSALRKIGCRGPVDGYGSLLRDHLQ